MAYRGAVRRITGEARRSGWFSAVDGITDRELRASYPEFVSRHASLLVPGSRGYGYWVWKPFLVLNALRRAAPSRAGIVYCDSGCALNVTAGSCLRMGEYFAIAQEGGGLCMQMPQHPEFMWTKNGLLDHLDLPDEHRGTGQVASGAFLLTADDRSIHLAERWLDVATREAYRFVDDSLSAQDLANPNFRSHRHDQSVFSCLAKLQGIPMIPDETYWAPEWETKGRSFPIWALRSRSRTRATDDRLAARLTRGMERLVNRAQASTRSRS